MRISIIKVSVFVALLGSFYLCGGFELPRKAFDTPIYYKHNPIIPWALIILCFVNGAACAIWGNKIVGIIHPISLRGFYIVLGALLMALALVFTSGVRFSENHRPNPSPDTTSTSVGVSQAQTQEISFWGELTWTLSPPVLILVFAVWCKRKMNYVG